MAKRSEPRLVIANELCPSAHGLVTVADLEAPGTSCTKIPCEMWMEIGKNLDNVDLLSLSSVRKLVAFLLDGSSKAELPRHPRSCIRSYPQEPLDPLPRIRVPQVRTVSTELPCRPDADVSNQERRPETQSRGRAFSTWGDPVALRHEPLGEHRSD